MAAELRVLDFGRVSPLRSQTLWHAIAYGVSAGAPPTLSFMRPSRPYVGVGFHRALDEVDLVACEEASLPVYRRMAGGGVVYLDGDQQFFQICLPATAVPPAREVALRQLLTPAVTAFRAAGVHADLDDDGEIVVGDRKVCGHGAAQIEDAVIVVGNLIEGFDHEAATRVLALPTEARKEVLRLMYRYVAANPVDSERFRTSCAGAYAEALSLDPHRGTLNGYERQRLAWLDRRFVSPEWLRGPRRPEAPCLQVKIRAGVWVLSAEERGARVTAAVVAGSIDSVRLHDPELHGAARLEERLRGLPLSEVGAALRGYGVAGVRLAAAFAKARPAL